MHILPFENKSTLLEAIRTEALPNGNLSIRGVARLAGVDHKSVVSSGEVGSTKLQQILIQQGFSGGELTRDGFPPQAVILVLNYFAHESKVKSKQAQNLLLTFGTIGLMETLRSLNEPPKPELPPTPQTYIDALKALVAAEEAKELLKIQNEELEKENEQLSEVVDELFNYSSIIRIAKFNDCHETQFKWRVLKAASLAKGIEIKEAPCPRFGRKLLYSHDVWRYCYPEANLPETTTLTIVPPSPPSPTEPDFLD